MIYKKPLTALLAIFGSQNILVMLAFGSSNIPELDWLGFYCHFVAVESVLSPSLTLLIMRLVASMLS